MINYLLISLAILLSAACLFLNGFAGMATALAAILLTTLIARNRPNLAPFIILPPALAMIFFSLQSFGLASSQASQEIATVYESIETTNRAFGFLTQGKNTAEANDFILAMEKGIQLADEVDRQEIDQLVPGFSTAFQEKYITGSSKLTQGFKEDDLGLKLQGGILMDGWAQWNLENKEKLEQARLKKPSPIVFLRELL